MFIKPKRRTSDSYGQGYYGASRGSRTHKGVDLRCDPHSIICSHVDGKVTKLGYPYSDDLSFRYVQVTDVRGLNHRFYYVGPYVTMNEVIDVGSPIGASQKLGDRYPVTESKPIPIQEHVHYEVLTYENGKKNYLDPNLFLDNEE